MTSQGPVLHPLRPGDPRTLGRFVLSGRLGMGGMGVAYAASTETGQAVVIKSVLADFADNAEFRRRFRREVLAASALQSPFVAEVLASDVSAERQWVALEYVPGPTLAELVSTQGPLDRQHQVALAAGLAVGLSELHASGLIHRDLKPANIICTPRGPRLIDFGVAVLQALPGVTSTGSLAPGSPGWMAPEQLDAYSAPSPAMDMFAWACVCWYAAVGASPIATDSVKEALHALRTWSSDDLRLPPELAPQLAPLVRRALAKSPDERASAIEVTRALEQLEGGDTAQLVADAWSPTLPADDAGTASLTAIAEDRKESVPRRRGAVAAAVAVVLLLGLISGLTVFEIWRPQRSLSGAVDESSLARPKPQSTQPDAPEPERAEASPASDEEASEAAKTPGALPRHPPPGYGGRQWVGYGAVKLGMTRAQLLSTGQTLDVRRSPQLACTNYPLIDGGYAGFSENLRRVVFIYFANKMSTSRAIHVGSTAREALAAYPGYVRDYRGAINPRIAPGVSYTIAFAGGRVVELVLLSDLQDCAN